MRFSRFKPKDGIDIHSAAFPEGIPSDPSLPQNQLQAAPQRLIAGEVTNDKGLNMAFRIGVGIINAGKGLGGPATKREIEAAPEWLWKGNF